MFTVMRQDFLVEAYIHSVSHLSTCSNTPVTALVDVFSMKQSIVNISRQTDRHARKLYSVR